MMRFTARRSSPLWQQQWQLDGQQQWGAVPHPQPSDGTRSFLERFDGDYIRTAVGFLDGLTTKGSVTVKACLGRTLFRLHTVPSSCVYRFNDLSAISYPRDIRSSWSNVCNDAAPAMRALINELKLAESGANLEPSRLKLTMRCCLASKGGPQYAKLTYFHENGRWVFAEVRALLDVYATHDISLDNSVEFRVKTYAELYTPGRAWWGSIQDLVLLDETDGDPLTTTATLVSSTRDDLSIEFVVIKRVSGSVAFRGLCFQLAEKGGCTCLQALLPKAMLAEMETGKRFEFLVSRLVEILDDLPGL